MTDADIHTLTGAYAVDALPDDERARFERHLAVCRACAVEVRELQATAARLGSAEHATPPAGMRDAVLARIHRTRQEPPLVGGRPHRDDATTAPAAPRGYPRLLATAAAVLALLVIGLTAVVANLNSRLDDAERLAAPVADLLTAPDAVVAVAEGPDGASMRFVASPTRGEGVFLVGGMQPAPSEHDYQLWFLRGEEAVPAGLLPVDDRGRGAHVVTGDLAQVSAVAVTVEPAGGSAQPTTDPIAVLQLPDA